MVGAAGLEPAHPYGSSILSAVRLPISPRSQYIDFNQKLSYLCKDKLYLYYCKIFFTILVFLTSSPFPFTCELTHVYPTTLSLLFLSFPIPLIFLQ